MEKPRRAVLSAVAAALALSACRSEPNACAPADMLNNEDLQNAMNAMVSAVETLHQTLGEFGAASPQVVAIHVKSAAAQVATSLTGLRQALGYPDSVEPQ